MTPRDNIYDHILPDLKDWPIAKFSEDRDNFIQRLIDYVLSKLTSSNNSVTDLINKTIYLEQKRVRTNPWKVDPSDEKEYWISLEKEMVQTKSAANPELEKIKILRRIIHRYSEEIIGHFVPKSHRFARKFLTALFKRLYNNGWGRGHKGIWGKPKDLLDKIHVDGKIDELRSLFQKGTVVIVPTHYTNLDSILIAFGIDQKVGIPAFSYGAGLNLYDVEILAYYMNRLGAYRVDRRKKNPVYLETLKSMASLSLTEGLNHIFFPGGTRSRSGAIEDKLKLGLLNSVIDAQRYSLLNGIDQKIFVVPLSVGYHFVLEADSLIDQYLKAEGRERYARRKKKKNLLKSLFGFLRKLRNKDSEVYLSFGQPMDILGNRVDTNGVSYDKRGNEIDINSYFSTGEEKNFDPQRESIYTRLLAEKIITSFKKDNIILSSHFIAYVCFKLIEDKHEDLNLFDLLKLDVSELDLPLDDVITYSQECLDSLAKLEAENKVKLSADLKQNGIEKLIENGINKVGVYHAKKVLRWKEPHTIGTEDLKLLYYYHNKMIQYELPSIRKVAST